MALGQAAGKTAAWVYGIEVGKSSPSPGDLATIAETLEVDVRWLIYGEVGPQTEFVARLEALQSRLDRSARRAILALAEHFARDGVTAADSDDATDRRAERDRLAAPFAEDEDGELAQPAADEQQPARRRARGQR